MTSDAQQESSLQRDLLLAVYLPSLMVMLGQGVLLATLPLYADTLGVSLTVISVISAAAGIGTLVMDVPAGVILNRLGLRSAMLIGCLLIMVGTFSLAVDMPPVLIVLMRVIAGIGTALWGVSRHAFIATTVPLHQRGKALSTFGGVMRIGTFGGPALGGLVARLVDLQASFVLTGILALFALIAGAIWGPPAATMHIARGGQKAGERWAIVRQRARERWKDLVAAGTGMILATMIRTGRQLLIPLYASRIVGLDAGAVGLVLSISSVVDMFMFIPAGYIMDNYGRKFATVPSFFIMGIGLAMVPFTHSFVSLAAVGLLIGFGNGIGSGTMMTLGADLAPEGATGEFLGVWRFVQDCGNAVAPLMVGVVASSVSLSGSAWVLAAAGFLASFTLWALVKETRVVIPKNEPAPAE